MGFRAIERRTGVTHNSVINWVRPVGQQLPDPPILRFQLLLKLMSLRASSPQKKQALVVGSSQWTKSWDSQLGARGPFCRDLLAPVVGSPLLEVFSLHHGRLLCLALLH